MHARRSAGGLEDVAGLSALRCLTSGTVLSIAYDEQPAGGGSVRAAQSGGPPPIPRAGEGSIAPPATGRSSPANPSPALLEELRRPSGSPPRMAATAAPPAAKSRKAAGAASARVEPAPALRDSAGLTGAAPALRSVATRSSPAWGGATVQLGAPLLPERAHDPSYYPGIVDEVPETAPTLERPAWKLWAGYIAAGLALFGAGLFTRSLVANPQLGWSVLIRTKPVDAKVTLDGRILIGQSPFRQDQLAPGEHQLRVERSGYVEFRESFLTNDQGGQREFVIVLDPIRALREAESAPLVPRVQEPRAVAPPTPTDTVPAAEVVSPFDEGKQRRLEARAERLARAQERREAAASERAQKRAERAAAYAARREAAAARAAERKEAAAARREARARKRAEKVD